MRNTDILLSHYMLQKALVYRNNAGSYAWNFIHKHKLRGHTHTPHIVTFHNRATEICNITRNDQYIRPTLDHLNTLIIATAECGDKTKQDRQCTYNVTLRRVCEQKLPWKSNTYCIFVCVNLRARRRVHARPCVRVALIIQHSIHMRHIVTSFVAPLAPPNFSTLSHKRRDYR